MRALSIGDRLKPGFTEGLIAQMQLMLTNSYDVRPKWTKVYFISTYTVK